MSAGVSIGSLTAYVLFILPSRRTTTIICDSGSPDNNGVKGAKLINLGKSDTKISMRRASAKYASPALKSFLSDER